ncbi:MAG: hypothetical protein AB1443_12205 [Pseudomonadota bacterium]
MHLTLMVPGLLLPVEILENITYDLNAPTLSLVLGSGARRALPEDWLPSAFGLDDLPAAAARKLGAGGTAQGEWLCLDPVRWHVASEGVTLDDPTKLELSDAEAAALIEAVTPLFADWGELSASAPGRWELQLKQPLTLETIPLPDAIQQAIDPNLPGGADGAVWRRLLAEAQTILHAHPVNRQREADNRPIVNSLWPWGQGRLPNDIQVNFQTVWSDDPVVAGVCAHAGMTSSAPPARYQPANGRVLAILEGLTTPARTLEALAWREALLALECDWLAPAVAALKRGECTGLRVIGTRFGHSPATVAYELKRSDLLRFWRKPLPLTELK